MNAAQRVQNGIKFLDEAAAWSDCAWDACESSEHKRKKEVVAKLKDWRSKINVSTLDLGSTQKCIVGQLFSPVGYGPGIEKLLGGAEYNREVRLGFIDGSIDGEHVSSTELTEAWTDALQGIRFQDGKVIFKAARYLKIVSSTPVNLPDGSKFLYMAVDVKSNGEPVNGQHTRWDYSSYSQAELNGWELHIKNPTPVGSFVLSDFGTVYYIRDEDTAIAMDESGRMIPPEGIHNPKPFMINGEKFTA